MGLEPIRKRDLELSRLRDKMTVVYGTRVGWEDKQRYRDHLIEMYSTGHLTEAEYDIRMEWVDLAITETELKVAFVDLPSMPLTERPKPKEKKKRPQSASYFIRRSPYYSGIFAGFEWGIFLIGLITWSPVTMTVCGLFGLMWTMITVYRYQKEKDNYE